MDHGIAKKRKQKGEVGTCPGKGGSICLLQVILTLPEAATMIRPECLTLPLSDLPFWMEAPGASALLFPSSQNRASRQRKTYEKKAAGRSLTWEMGERGVKAQKKDS